MTLNVKKYCLLRARTFIATQLRTKNITFSLHSWEPETFWPISGGGLLLLPVSIGSWILRAMKTNKLACLESFWKLKKYWKFESLLKLKTLLGYQSTIQNIFYKNWNLNMQHITKDDKVHYNWNTRKNMDSGTAWDNNIYKH